MSIILKALKKAEEKNASDKTINNIKVLNASQNKKVYAVIAGLAVTALLVFTVIYWYSAVVIRFKAKEGRIAAAPSVNAKLDAPATAEKQSVSEKPAYIPPVPPAQAQKNTAQDLASINIDAVNKIKKKDFRTAEKILLKAAEIDTSNPELYNHLGLAFKGQGRYKEAYDAYMKALQLKPAYPEAMNNLAIIYEKLGDTKKSKDLYEKATSQNPAYAEAHLNYALLLESMGYITEAESHYRKFLNISPDTDLKNKVRERLKWIKE